MSDIIMPVANVNGTSRKALKDQQLKVLGCLTAAIEAMAEAAPHGRDYQTQPGLWEQADRRHRERVKAVQGVIDETYAIALSLRD